MPDKMSSQISDLVKHGIEQYMKQDNEAAVVTFSKVIALDADHQQAYRYRGISYCSLAEYESARADLERAVTFDSSDTEALFWLGMALHNIGFEPNTAATLRPNWTRTVDGLQFDQQIQLTALNYIDQAIEQQDDYFYVYQRATICDVIGQPQKARQNYENILNRTDLEWPDYREAALLGRARTYLSERKFEQAERDIADYNSIQLSKNRSYAQVNFLDLRAKYDSFS